MWRAAGEEGEGEGEGGGEFIEGGDNEYFEFVGASFDVFIDGFSRTTISKEFFAIESEMFVILSTFFSEK